VNMSKPVVRPLSGLLVDGGFNTPAEAEAARLLASLGAACRQTLSRTPQTGIVLSRPGMLGTHTLSAAARLGGPITPLPGLPELVPTRAAAVLLALGAVAALAGELSDVRAVVEPADVAAMLLLPFVMARSYGAPPPTPSAPLPWRREWLSTELCAAGDQEAFARLVPTLPENADALDVSTEAQTWRLPVVPYRRWADISDGRCSTKAPFIVGLSGTLSQPRPLRRIDTHPLGGVRVLDATVMWAGPLATWILSRLGATVKTIEPAARPDGARAPDGGGIYPAGRLARGDGTRSGMFNALAWGKQRWDLDLRCDGAREALHREVGHTDLILDNLSPRARAQLGMTAGALRSHNQDLIAVTIPAFGPGEQRGWVAYGAQVHAMSGLAWSWTDVPRIPLPAAAAYPDVLTGMLAALAAVAALVGRTTGWRPNGDIEVPLASSVAGLLPGRQDRSLLAEDPTPVADRLLDNPDRFTSMLVEGEPRAHPREPLQLMTPRD
jgi:hypothetical protein